LLIVSLISAKGGNIKASQHLLWMIKECLESGESLTPSMSSYLISAISNILPGYNGSSSINSFNNLSDANKALLLKPTAKQVKDLNGGSAQRMEIAFDVHQLHNSKGFGLHKNPGGAYFEVSENLVASGRSMSPRQVERIYTEFIKERPYLKKPHC